MRSRLTRFASAALAGMLGAVAVFAGLALLAERGLAQFPIIYQAGTSAPTSDAAFDLGTSDRRWRDVYTAGQILAPDGSAGAPGYAFANDPDTGIARSQSGVFSLFSNGQERLRASPQEVVTTTQIRIGTSSGGVVFNANDLQAVSPIADYVQVYVDESTDRGGTAAADCALVARLSSGVEVVVSTLVTDGGCP